MRYWILGILLALLPSCRKGEVPATTPPEQPDTGDTGVEVRFSAGVTASVVEQASFSRAPFDGNFLPEGKQVGVFGLLANINEDGSYTGGEALNKNVQENLSNACYTVTDESGNMAQDNIAKYPDGGGYNGLVFYGYYPYSSSLQNIGATVEGNRGVPVELGEQNCDSEFDYLYTGPIAKKVTLNPVNLSFKHALARIQFNLSSTTTSATKVYNIAAITESPFAETRLMSIKNGDIVDKSTSTRDYYQYSMQDGGELLPSASTPLVADLMVYPGIKITSFELQIGEKYYTLNTSILPIKGTKTIVNVSFSPIQVSFTQSIAEWGTQGVTNATIDEESGEVDVTK